MSALLPAALRHLSLGRSVGRGVALAASAALLAAAPPPAAPAGAPAAPAASAPATHRVRMVGDERGYRFEPAVLTVAPGDRVTWVMVSGGPHNVQFDEAAVPAAAKARLAANMPEASADLTGPLLVEEGKTYTMSFAGVPAGSYKYVCTPHLAMDMTGTVVVRGAAARPAAKAAKPAAAAGRRPGR